MQNRQLSKKMQKLQNRFQEIMRFFKRETLAEQPWYLLVGPSQVGKTHLLLHAAMPFILKRQFPTHPIPLSDSIDFWVTEEHCLIDVPGKTEMRLWQYFLNLIKKHRGKQAVAGIILALSYSEQSNINWKPLLARLNEIQKVLTAPIPCYVVITKCDRLPGFAEFFAEYTDEEATQTWGITLPAVSPSKLEAAFVERSDALIKQLNKQLLSQLHRVYDPVTKLTIKNFPFQVERLKTFLLYFIKSYSAYQNAFPLQNIHLTSAIQQTAEMRPPIELNETRAIQLFKEPPTMRPYFIQQWLLKGLTLPPRPITPAKLSTHGVYRALIYSLTAGLILSAGTILSLDFKIAAQQTKTVKSILAHYHSQSATDDALKPTLALLNGLRPLTEKRAPTFGIKHLFSFYTHRSLQQTHLIYREAIKTLFVPALKAHLMNFLTNPDHPPETLHTALQAYLMLKETEGDPETLTQALLPMLAKYPAAEKNNLSHDLQVAWAMHALPITLDEDLIQKFNTPPPPAVKAHHK